MEAIRSATQINAQFFGIDDRLGTIEIGKTADLTLVDGDPSQDIAAMRSVKHVMLNGIWVGESP
jgi:imidazolonepropionase-like amidohydrolase